MAYWSLAVSLAISFFLPRALAAELPRSEAIPGLVGTAIAYEQGGYETSPAASNVAPGVEKILMGAMQNLLQP